MNILYVATISDTINGFLVPHIKLLIDQGHKVDIACNVVSELSPELLVFGCNVYNIEFQRSPLRKENYKAYKEIKKLISRRKYELVHTHTPIASFLTRFACRNIPNLKVLYTAHGFHFFKGAKLISWLIYYTLEVIAAKWTDGIITINKEDFNRALKMSIRKSGKAYIIPGIGVSENRFKPVSIEEKSILRKKYEFKDDDFLMVYAAELNKNKNQRFLIECMAVLKNKIPNIKLILAGEGEQREEYIDYISSLGLDEDVKLLGFRNDLDRIIPMCDVGVSSSLREGFGINLVEYMSCGLPVVASDNRGHREIVKDGVDGFLFEKVNTNQFVKLVEGLYIDSELRKKLGENARANSKDFTIEKSLDHMKSIYQECYK